MAYFPQSFHYIVNDMNVRVYDDKHVQVTYINLRTLSKLISSLRIQAQIDLQDAINNVGVHAVKDQTLQILGMSVALLGAVCASGPEIKGGLAVRPIILAVIAACGFGGAVTFIAKGSETSALMTMTTMRFTTFIVALFLFIRFRSVGGLSKKDLPILILIGGADFAGNLLLGVATTKGLVSVAVVLGALYPIITALLAYKFLNEILHKIQYLGIAFAITGVAFISLG